MYCHNCGTEVGPDVQFCPNCGQAQGVALGAAPAVPWQPPQGVHSATGSWISQGWNLVKADIGMFIVLTLVFGAINSAVPFLLQGALTAGLEIYCIKKLLGRQGDFADLFAGFNFFVPTLVAGLVIGLFVGVGTLFCIIPGLVLAAMYKFTFLFIVDKRMDFWQAMQASHAVVRNDYFGFTMFLLALVGINILGLLCCVVGLLISVPVSFAAITIAYKEVVGFDPRTVQGV